jgi:DNA-binding winged helix-turn-helix (wHTH) protein
MELEFIFADHLLDIDRRELRRGGERIALEPQVFDLLVYLVRNRERVVTKDDLLEAVWGGRIVSESTMTRPSVPVARERFTLRKVNCAPGRSGPGSQMTLRWRRQS